MNFKKENQETFNILSRLFDSRKFDASSMYMLTEILKDASPEVFEIKDKYGRNLLHIAVDNARVNAVEVITKNAPSSVFSMLEQNGLSPLEKSKRNFHMEFSDYNKRMSFKVIEHVIIKEMRQRNLLKNTAKAFEKDK